MFAREDKVEQRRVFEAPCSVMGNEELFFFSRFSSKSYIFDGMKEKTEKKMLVSSVRIARP